MARKGGFKPPEQLKDALGSLLRTTLQQAGVVRDVLERGAREAGARLDEATSSMRSGGKRKDALAELGEIVLELIRKGEIDPEELPEVKDVVQRLDELDASHDGHSHSHDGHSHSHSHDDHAHDGHSHDDDRGREGGPTFAMPTSRARFDDRSAQFSPMGSPSKPAPTRGREPTPTLPGTPRGRANANAGRSASAAGAAADEDDDDDVVSSTTGRFAAPPPKPAPRVWRPINEPPAPPDEEPTRPPPFRDTSPPPTRKGGITFGNDPEADDDSDLASYMNPADVPSKDDPDSKP